MFANGWFTACDGFYGASAYWLSHETINHYHYHTHTHAREISMLQPVQQYYKLQQSKLR